NRRIVVRLLERWGLTARASASPTEALGWVAGGESFDLAVLDLHMRELDGIALATALKATPAGATTACVVLSSLGVHERPTHVVSSFLITPVKPSSLFYALVRALTSL